MDWVATVSSGERERQELTPENLKSAVRTFYEQGCLLLEGAIDVSLVDRAHREWQERFGDLDLAAMTERVARPGPNRLYEVGDARFEVAVEMTGGFADPRLFGNRILRGLMRALLGPAVRLNSFTVVVSHPGAPAQHVHRDHGHLFEQWDTVLPVYGVNVAVPIIDVNREMGPTAVWPGSHRQQASQPTGTPEVAAFRRGDVMLIDYRTMHAGMSNRSSKPRPVLYMVYARTWFFDEINHMNRPAVDMPLAQYELLPEEAKPLLSRALSAEMRKRREDLDRPAPVVSGGPPCPCGNGQPFASCHGREG